MAWKKGESGNPNGRKTSPKVLEMVELAREECPRAIERASRLLDDVDGRIAMSAAVFLRDTGIGRPSQVEFDLAQVPDEKLIEEIERRREIARQREEQQRVDSLPVSH